MKRIRKNLTLAALALAAVFVSSCGGDDNLPGPSPTSHKVYFKAEASSGANISVAVYGYDNTLTSASSLSGTTWQSPEITVPAGATLATAVVNAASNSTTATLKVQVYVDGTLKKEGTSSGSAMSAQVSYSF